MKFFIGLLLFVVAYILSLATSLGGMGYVGGPDIGFAGAGLWFVMIPAALIGTLLAYPISRSMSDDAGLQRFYFLLAAPLCAWFLGALPMWVFEERWNVHYLPMPSPYVYIPGKDFYVVAQAVVAENVIADQPVPIELQWQYGSWDRVHQTDVPEGVTYFSVQPAPNDPRIASAPTLEAEPTNCMKLQSFDNKTGKGVAVFSSTNSECQIISSVKVAATGEVQKRSSFKINVQNNAAWPPMPPPTPLPKAQLKCDRSGLIVHCKTDDVVPVNP